MKFSPQTAVAMVATGFFLSPFITVGHAGSQNMRDELSNRIGGANYVVTGEITNVNGTNYTVRTSGGDQIQLNVTDDTNMFCESRSNRSQSRQTSTSNQQNSSSGSAQDSKSQDMPATLGVNLDPEKSQRERKAQQTGFRIGDCPFQEGDRVKAELTDVGTVTFIRSIDPVDLRTAGGGRNSEENWEKGSGRSTEDMGLPRAYLFLPAGALGNMHMSQDSDKYKVKSSDGKEIGQVEKIIINAQGDPEYVIIRKKDDQQLKPVPWEAVKFTPDTQSVTLEVTGSQLDQMPGYSANDMTMRDIRGFWELSEDEHEGRDSRQQARFNQRDGRSDQRYDNDFQNFSDESGRRSSFRDRDRFSDDDRFEDSRFSDSRDRNDRYSDRYGSRDRYSSRDQYGSQGRYGSNDQYDSNDRYGSDDRYRSNEERQSFYSQGREGSGERGYSDNQRYRNRP